MKINYPRGFYSFENGKKVSNIEINKRIESVVNEVKKGAEYSYISFGDTIVIALNIGGEVEVIVAKNYKTMFID